MENNGDPSVKLIRELRAENERLRNSNENTNLLLLTDSYKVMYHKITQLTGAFYNKNIYVNLDLVLNFFPVGEPLQTISS